MPDPTSKGQANCIIMVYMAGDATLANFGVRSLKELQAAATEQVVVAAQFDPEGSYDIKKARRFVFDEESHGKPLHIVGKRQDQKFWTSDDRKIPMTSPKALTEFINWAYSLHPEAKHHCLILWGHGPELLFELPETTKNSENDQQKTKRLYFTPVELASAIREAGKALDIIGMDACSMSLAEFAYELQGLAKYMVASQREVPDLSFPYGVLLDNLQTQNWDGEASTLCKAIIDCYVAFYRDCICDAQTQMEAVTLCALDLKKINDISRPLDALAHLLQGSASDKMFADAIYEARQKAQSFVGGLFVDLYDFCEKLIAKSAGMPADLKCRCDEICGAISNCIVKNERMLNSDDSCHGLSIYFPYLSDEEKKYIEQNLVKGIPRALDKSSDLAMRYQTLDAEAAGIRQAVRRKMIGDTEQYYTDPEYKFGKATKWYDFIQCEWSRILAERERSALDIRYSAEQCAKNLLRPYQPLRSEDVGSQKKAGFDDGKPAAEGAAA